MPPYGQSKYSDIVPARGARQSPKARRFPGYVEPSVALYERDPRVNPPRNNELYDARQAVIAQNEAENAALTAAVEAEEPRPRRRPAGTLTTPLVTDYEAGIRSAPAPGAAPAWPRYEVAQSEGVPHAAMKRAIAQDVQAELAGMPLSMPLGARRARWPGPAVDFETTELRATPLVLDPAKESFARETGLLSGGLRRARGGRMAVDFESAAEFPEALSLPATSAPMRVEERAAKYLSDRPRVEELAAKHLGGAPAIRSIPLLANPLEASARGLAPDAGLAPEWADLFASESELKASQSNALVNALSAGLQAVVDEPGSSGAPVSRGGGGPLLPAGWGAMALSQARRRPTGQLQEAALRQAPAPGEARRFKVSAGDTLIKMEGEAPELYYSTDQGEAMLAEWEAAAAEEARMKTPAADGGSRSAILREGVGAAISNGEKVRLGVNKRAAAAQAAQAQEEALGAELGNIWELPPTSPEIRGAGRGASYGRAAPQNGEAPAPRIQGDPVARAEASARSFGRQMAGRSSYEKPGRSRLEADLRGAPSPYELTQRGLASAEKSQRWGYAGDVPTLDEQLRRKVVKYAGRPEAEAAFLGEMAANARGRESGASQERRQRMVSDSARDQETTRAMGGVAEKQIQAGVDLANKSAELEAAREQDNIKNELDRDKWSLDVLKEFNATNSDRAEKFDRTNKRYDDLLIRYQQLVNSRAETYRRALTKFGEAKETPDEINRAAKAVVDGSPEGQSLLEQMDDTLQSLKSQGEGSGVSPEDYRPKSGRTRGGMASILDVADRKKSSAK
jgi:hypothetical protein